MVYGFGRGPGGRGGAGLGFRGSAPPWPGHMWEGVEAGYRGAGLRG